MNHKNCRSEVSYHTAKIVFFKARKDVYWLIEHCENELGNFLSLSILSWMEIIMLHATMLRAIFLRIISFPFKASQM